MVSIQSIRKEFADKLNVSEDDVGNAINEVIMLDKKYIFNVSSVKSQSEGLGNSLRVLNLAVVKDSLSEEAKWSYIRMNLLRAIKPILASSVNNENLDLFLKQLERELKTNWNGRMN